MREITRHGRDQLVSGKLKVGPDGIVSIDQVPLDLIWRRDSWRNFWRHIPILGKIYHRFFYLGPWLKWERDNGITAIRH